MSLNKDGKIRVAVVGLRAFRGLEPWPNVAIPVNSGCFSHVMSDDTMREFIEHGIEIHGVAEEYTASVRLAIGGFIKLVRASGAGVTFVSDLVPGDFYDWVLLSDDNNEPVCAFGYIEEGSDD